MAQRRRSKPRPRDQAAGSPAQQDEADIIEEVGAAPDPDADGELVVDEDKILEVGAVDAESIRENRRLQDVVNKKRGGQKGVVFNSDDLLTRYETVLKYWPAGSLYITMRRLTGGSGVTDKIESEPRSGAELYDALMAKHGQNEEATYAIKIVDKNNRVFRGNGRITLPDTRKQGQPMNQYPQGYPPGQMPPTQQPQPQAASPMEGMVSTMRQMFEMFQTMQSAAHRPNEAQPTAPVQPQPQQQFAPVTPDMNGMISAMQQMFEMFQSMHRQATPQQQAAMPQMPANPDMGSMMGWTQQMFEMFRSMQPPQPQPQPQHHPSSRGGHHQQPQPQMQMPNPMAAMLGMPPIQPPAGTIWVPGFGFVPLERLTQAIGGGGHGPGVGEGPHRPPYRPQYRPPYGPQYRGEDTGPPGYGPPHHQAQPQKTAAEQFREALTVVRTAVEAVQDINSMLPNHMTGMPGMSVAQEPEDDDSPVQVIDTGAAKIVVNKKDGSARFWETGWANMDKVFKFVGDLREQIQTQQQQQPQQRVLPPGYVEVGPNYRPPPGYVAVPVEHPHQAPHRAPHQEPRHQAPQMYDEEELPPPPEHVPPPINRPAAARPVWGPPTIPDEVED
jgi:hypothetical protein